MPLKLRRALRSDAEALTDIMQRSKASWGYTPEQAALIKQHDHVTRDQIAGQHVIVAERDGQPVAYLAVEPMDAETLLIDHIFVCPDHQGNGLGKLLLLRAEDHARQHRLSRLYLISDVHAGSFYEKHGFETVGTIPSKLVPGHFAPEMEKRLKPNVHELQDLSLTVSEDGWAFETQNKAEIDTYFKAAQQRIPLLWNGRTLKLTGYAFADGRFHGTCTECSYAAFLTWRDWGAPDLTTHNLFGSAILRSKEGHLLFGVMSERTATAGQIYPPGGNLDPDDVTAGGSVDVRGAIYRELQEETGLQRNDVVPGSLLVAFDGPRISIAQVFDIHRPADELRTSILTHSEASEEQELSDVRIIRSPADLNDPAIVPYARYCALHLLEKASAKA
ncbi:GNAT family N-acetyltransferase [Roseibium denhamense]|uniref:N-acetylglutamate synthase, GNAT family n=1 Tax=Roseibium denhamense TaxID=76305 RepID=A0ABY1NA62_9HYPH|nr:GNAT family N-acetyltransferase [Roseibium denhamense]MTI06517.1 GNAT family N-acetyltransferase [Roseibium denhamense]SMP04487.1 N-acetylglutamate synthase, GNAT family [Roseibium denhamense]